MLVLGTYGAGETFFTLKGELEAKMPGWEIIIAPNEAVQLVKFMKDFA